MAFTIPKDPKIHASCPVLYYFKLASPAPSSMRYNDWDVVLCPAGRDEQIPLQEFRVACHVVNDDELGHMQVLGSPGLPVVTAYVPSLQAGSPFRVSIRSWRNPEISQFARSYSKHTDLVKFQARVLIDGRLVTCVRCAYRHGIVARLTIPVLPQVHDLGPSGRWYPPYNEYFR